MLDAHTLLCSLYGFNNFLCVRVAFSIDDCHLFPQCMLAIIPLIGGVSVVLVIRTCSGYCAGPLLCFMVFSALFDVGSAF